MAVIGKGSLSLKKKDVAEQKSVALGFKKVRFAHKASLGDTGINLTSLVAPSEMSIYGFINPSVATLSAVQLNFYRNNLKLISSFRGLLIDQLSYVVSSSTMINFVDFTAQDGEIFTGILDEAPTTSLNVVDGRTIVASGILIAGQTDFNIGTPIITNQNPSQQIGAVMVYVDRGLQYRRVGNISTGDGDYIEVPVSGGLGSLIRFPSSSVDRFITVISNGVVAERPDGSMMAAIERVQGQVDAMVPVLADTAGLPTTTFQTAPNSIDLKQFGNTVSTNTITVANHETRIASIEDKTTQIALEIFITPTGGPGTNGAFGTYLWAIGGIIENTFNAYNPATGIWTCPKAGRYVISGCVSTGGTYASYGQAQLFINLNGTQVRGDLRINSSSLGLVTPLLCSTIKLNQGDQIFLQGYMANWTSFAITSGVGGANYFTITRTTT